MCEPHHSGLLLPLHSEHTQQVPCVILDKLMLVARYLLLATLASGRCGPWRTRAKHVVSIIAGSRPLCLCW